MALKQKYGVVAIKTGTEVEDMSFEEIRFIKDLTYGILPLTVKIGGPEARQDIRFLLGLGVHTILAPMIESVYALRNFVQTLLHLYLEMSITNKPALGINLETRVAFSHLSDILHSPYFEQIFHITIGRKDLADSMNMAVNHKKLLKMIHKCVEQCKKQNKSISVGGGLSMDWDIAWSTYMGSGYLNTRHVMFQNNFTSNKQYQKVLHSILDWEKNLYYLLQIKFPERLTYFQSRLDILEKRQVL